MAVILVDVNSGCILKVEPIEFASEFDVRWQRRKSDRIPSPVGVAMLTRWGRPREEHVWWRKDFFFFFFKGSK